MVAFAHRVGIVKGVSPSRTADFFHAETQAHSIAALGQNFLDVVRRILSQCDCHVSPLLLRFHLVQTAIAERRCNRFNTALSVCKNPSISSTLLSLPRLTLTALLATSGATPMASKVGLGSLLTLEHAEPLATA